MSLIWKKLEDICDIKYIPKRSPGYFIPGSYQVISGTSNYNDITHNSYNVDEGAIITNYDSFIKDLNNPFKITDKKYCVDNTIIIKIKNAMELDNNYLLHYLIQLRSMFFKYGTKSIDEQLLIPIPSMMMQMSHLKECADLHNYINDITAQILVLNNKKCEIEQKLANKYDELSLSNAQDNQPLIEIEKQRQRREIISYYHGH